MIDVKSFFKKGKLFILYDSKTNLYTCGKVYSIVKSSISFYKKNKELITLNINSPNIICPSRVYFLKAKPKDIFRYKKENKNFLKIQNSFLSKLPLLSENDYNINNGDKVVIRLGFYYFTAKVKYIKHGKNYFSEVYTVQLPNKKIMEIPFFLFVGKASKIVKTPIPLNKLPFVLKGKFISNIPINIAKIMYSGKFEFLTNNDKLFLSKSVKEMTAETFDEILKNGLFDKANNSIKNIFITFLPKDVLFSNFEDLLNKLKQPNLSTELIALISRLSFQDKNLIEIALNDDVAKSIVVYKVNDDKKLLNLFKTNYYNTPEKSDNNTRDVDFLSAIANKINPTYLPDILQIVLNDKVKSRKLKNGLYIISEIVGRINPKFLKFVLNDKDISSRDNFKKELSLSYEKYFGKLFLNIESNKIIDVIKKYDDLLRDCGYYFSKDNMFRLTPKDAIKLLKESKYFSDYFLKIDEFKSIENNDVESRIIGSFLQIFSKEDIEYYYNTDPNFKKLIQNMFKSVKNNLKFIDNSPMFGDEELKNKRKKRILTKFLSSLVLYTNFPVSLIPKDFYNYMSEDLKNVLKVKEEAYFVSKQCELNLNNKEKLYEIIKNYIENYNNRLRETSNIDNNEYTEGILSSLLIRNFSPYMIIAVSNWFDTTNSNLSYILKKFFGNVLYQDSQDMKIADYKFVNENPEAIKSIKKSIIFIKVLTKVVLDILYPNQDDIFLFRGFFLPSNASESLKKQVYDSINKEVYVYTNPISSWTEDIEVAETFCKSNTIKIKNTNKANKLTLRDIRNIMESSNISVIFQSKVSKNDIVFFYRLFTLPDIFPVNYFAINNSIYSEKEFVVYSKNNKRLVKTITIKI